jgi:hypothetical protein
MAPIDGGGIRWHKSSRSAWDNCVEVARLADGVLVRDSKDPGGAVVAFGGPGWRAFLAALGDGRLEPQTRTGEPQTGVGEPQTGAGGPQTRAGGPQTSTGGPQKGAGGKRTRAGGRRTGVTGARPA